MPKRGDIGSQNWAICCDSMLPRSSRLESACCSRLTRCRGGNSAATNKQLPCPDRGSAGRHGVAAACRTVAAMRCVRWGILTLAEVEARVMGKQTKASMRVRWSDDIKNKTSVAERIS